MKKVLFLDIDGVLNSEYTTDKMCVNSSIFDGLDRHLVHMYLTWLKDKPVNVVLSSSWRSSPISMDTLTEAGISWVDTTPNFGNSSATGRANEINYWIKINKPEKVAILDDLPLGRPVHQYLVQTSYIHGLREKDLRKVERLLEL